MARGRALPTELLRPALEALDVDDGRTIALEVDDGDLKLGGVSTEYIFQHADGGFTAIVSAGSLARRLLDELDR